MSSQPVPFSWQQVDQTLANLMLADVSTEFGILLREDTQHIHYQNIGNGNGLTVPSQRLEMHRLRTDELAARHYAVYCEVWRSQQKPLTPEFLRAICPNSLQVLRSARVNGVSSEFSLEQMRTHSPDNQWLKSAMEEFRRSMDRLYGKWEKLAEIDAKGLEHLLAAAANKRDVDTAATEVVHARIQVRIVEARLASIQALIESCEGALSATQLRQPDNYRIKSLEQRLEGLKADKKQFEQRRDDWQRSQDTALRRSAELRRTDISNPFFDEEIQGVVGELPSREQKYREEPSVNPEPNCAGTIGPEKEIAQARERVRHFEAEIAAVDTKIAAFQQSLTEAIVRGTSTFKPRDIDRAIRKLHADRKELEFRRDDWNISLNSVLNRLAGERKPDIAGQSVSSAPQLPAVPTLASKAVGAQLWHGLHIEFKALAEEELRKDPNNKKDQWLRAYVTRNLKNGEEWSLSSGVDEGFRARFEVLATRAGIALGAQPGSTPTLESWLHALFEDLLAHQSRELFAAKKRTAASSSESARHRRRTARGLSGKRWSKLIRSSRRVSNTQNGRVGTANHEQRRVPNSTTDLN